MSSRTNYVNNIMLHHMYYESVTILRHIVHHVTLQFGFHWYIYSLWRRLQNKRTNCI